jgi:DNA-binding PadR family transcriptional regulator
MSSSTLSHAATAVLQAIARGFRHGFDVTRATGLPSGTVYPALRRLEEAGLVTSAWEDHRLARQAQRPPRKYYEVTRRGDEALAAALKRYRLLERGDGARRLRPAKA